MNMSLSTDNPRPPPAGRRTACMNESVCTNAAYWLLPRAGCGKRTGWNTPMNTPMYCLRQHRSVRQHPNIRVQKYNIKYIARHSRRVTPRARELFRPGFSLGGGGRRFRSRLERVAEAQEFDGHVPIRGCKGLRGLRWDGVS